MDASEVVWDLCTWGKLPSNRVDEMYMYKTNELHEPSLNRALGW